MREGETRRVQITGKSSYIVSIPKRWVEELGLKPRDEVMIVRHGISSIQIMPKRMLKQQQRDATIHVGSKSSADSVLRDVISLYLLGYSVINIRAEQGRLASELKKVVKESARRLLMGTEVTADSMDNITIQVLLNVMELSIDNAFKRMLLLTKSMLKESLVALKESNTELAREVIAGDDEVDRFSFYIVRQLNIAVENEYLLADMGLSKLSHCLDYRLIVKSVERIADHATGIAQQVLDNGERIDEDTMNRIIGVSSEIINVLDESCLALFKMDASEAKDAITKAKSIIEREKTLMDGFRYSSDRASYKVRFIVENVKRIAEYVSDIGELVLNMTIEQILRGILQSQSMV
ncbi:MAG: phosphate uptake regulator PhoU [Candidatus Nitrosocaldus sp.]